MSRRLASTPSAEKSQLQVGLGAGEAESAKAAATASEASADTGDATMGDLRPSPQLAQQVAAEGGLSGSAVDDTTMKDEADEPEYSPPEPAASAPLVETPSQMSAGGGGQVGIPREVTNVLAQLAQIRK
jgi:hypothetical protein